MAQQLPDYVASAQPNPKSKRMGWLTTTAATYAGIMLWFVFWQDVPIGDGTKAGVCNFAGGALASGIGVAIVGVIIAAALCHFCCYLVPGLLGMKTGLPLYIVGTSTYGVQGGFIMPGFLMGVLQFGWLAVNAFFSSAFLIASVRGVPLDEVFMTVPQLAVGIIWAVGAAFVGLKGIQYVGKIASYMPAIPLIILLVLVAKTIGGVGAFDEKKAVDNMLNPASAEAVAPEATDEEPATPVEEETPVVAPEGEAPLPAEGAEGVEGEDGDTGSAGDEAADAPAEDEHVFKAALGAFGVLAMICAYIVGFFATAGAAGADFGMNNKDDKAVQMGGLVGVFGVTVFTGICAIIIVAGVQGMEGAQQIQNALRAPRSSRFCWVTAAPRIAMFLLAVAAFPPACFSSFIAANSFKTTLPKTNPFVSCGIGTLGSIILIVSGFAGQAIDVFTLIGASFGPICGAMMADYLLSGKKWAGPRAGFNPAGWISWAVGFVVGGYGLAFKLMGMEVWVVPAPPVAALIVGFVLYYALSKAGMESEVLEMPAGTEAPE